MSLLLVDLLDKGGDFFVDHEHEAKDTQHGSTSVVELDGTLGDLDLLFIVVLAKIDVAVAKAVHEFTACSFDITPEIYMRR